MAGAQMKTSKSVVLARVFFVLIATLIGCWIGLPRERTIEYSLIAFISSLIFVLFEYSTNIISSKKILLAAIGLFCGLAVSFLIYPTIPAAIMSQMHARIVCNLLFGYFGIVVALKHEDRFSLSRLKFIITNPTGTACILDTNVIIDGRVIDIYQTNFLRGPLIVPNFVLDELQLIADSHDPQKRARGRRGLENLERLRDVNSQLQIYEKDFENIKDVDHKLIQLAKEINGSILTNDYNLNKVASLHQVQVLNINDLAQAIRPTVLIGDTIKVRIIREGKEENQGVGYLEDGTMVVVDEGRPHIGLTLEVVVTSVLQTSAGRMIFGKIKSDETVLT
jgi:uncharacterized protein YacL